MQLMMDILKYMPTCIECYKLSKCKKIFRLKLSLGFPESRVSTGIPSAFNVVSLVTETQAGQVLH